MLKIVSITTDILQILCWVTIISKISRTNILESSCSPKTADRELPRLLRSVSFKIEIVETVEGKVTNNKHLKRTKCLSIRAT